MIPLVSIVIPCYNSGRYLPEALDSITSYKGKSTLEVIIVDDGSTDIQTLQLLDKLKMNNYVVLHQPNGGPAAARNTGVKAANSEFILFLDSDNKIRANDFIDKGIAILEGNSEIGVFYGNPAFFGDVTGERLFEKGPFDFKRILRYNYIDMCSIVRKQTWSDVGGLDENRLIMGHEDWDFWLRIGRTKWKFYHLDKTLFDYRVVQVSMITQSLGSDRYNEMVNYILAKQGDVLPSFFTELFYELKVCQAIRRKELDTPFRTFVKSVLTKAGWRK